jgi:hypothetical protein
MQNRTHGRFSAVSAIGLLGAAVVGFLIGRGPQSALAAPPAQPPKPPANAAPVPPSDWDKRVVAYIYDSIPVTREDLGEYLIARHGLDCVELLVNKKIIEHACQLRNITVTDAEVEASIISDCATIGVKKEEFIQKVLKQYNKTLYEWKEDVIKPRLLLTQLVKKNIARPTDEEVRLAFNATYGEKRDCRIIIWPKEEKNIAFKEYDAIRSSEEGFAAKARTQALSYLAATGGKINPIARNSGVHPAVEQAAFSLKPGEVSTLLDTPEGIVVMKMDAVVPANTTVKFEDKRAWFETEVYEKKVAAEIPKLVKALRDEAKPIFFLKKPDDATTIKREVEQEIKPVGGIRK